MYPEKNLYKIYKKSLVSDRFSIRLPDFSKRLCLEIMNTAINCCDKWDNFLDVGANTGNYSIPLLQKFKNGTAVEVEPNKTLTSVALKYKNLTVYNDYIQNMSTEQSFDFVLLSDVFEHIPIKDIQLFIDKISSIQEIGGVAYISMPNPFFCGPAEKSAIHYTKHNHGHHKHYTKEETVALWEENGYKLIFHCYEYHQLRQLLEKLFWRFSIKDNFLYNKSSHSLR